MIPNKHHHYSTLGKFLEKKFSADPKDTSYTTGGSTDIIPGEPDISWRSIVYIKDPGLIATHGKIYDGSGLSRGLWNPVLINGTSFDGTSEITTETWGTARGISIASGECVSPAVSVNGGGDVSLLLPDLIDSKVTKDSLGREIISTYPTNQDLQDAFDRLDTFYVYSGDTDDNPSLLTLPASEWEDYDLHAGDYYVTSEGRIFIFEEDPVEGWRWREITDYYLYNCLSRLLDIQGKVDSRWAWEGPQGKVETGEIYVLGVKSVLPYLDILSCPGAISYSLGNDTNLYLPFSYGGAWTRTLTSYSRETALLDATGLYRALGKTIVVTNLPGSLGSVTFILGDTPEGTNQSLTLPPGKVCILKLSGGPGVSGKMEVYWEASGPCDPVEGIWA